MKLPLVGSKVQRVLAYAAWTAVLVSLLGFAEFRHHEKTCAGLRVVLADQPNAYFLTEEDVRDLITDGETVAVSDVAASQINLKKLEDRLKRHSFVRGAQVSRQLDGILLAHVEQAQPIARLLDPNGQDRYVSAEGKLLPMSVRYTARVLPVAGVGAQRVGNATWYGDPYYANLFALLSYIHYDPFWRAQVAYLNVAADGRITMRTQIGKQVVTFGQPERLAARFEKLAVFYKTILPTKGWNAYQRVNIEYEDQIVCE